MNMTQNKHTDMLLVLAKDVLFIGLGCFLILRVRGFFGTILGALALIWYGRDFWYRGKAFLGTKESRREPVERPSEPKQPDSTPIVDDGRIQVTDLSGAKEVDFEKE